MYSFDKQNINCIPYIFFIIEHCDSNGYKICRGTKMLIPLDEEKKKENMILDDSLTILGNI